MPIIAASSTHPGAQYRGAVLGLPPGPSSLRRRSSEVGNVFDVQNAQEFNSLTQYPTENQRPIPNAYTPNDQWPGPSPVISGTQYPSAGTAYVNMIPGMSSSLTHRGSVTSLNPATTSGLQDHILSGSASSSASHIDGHSLPQQGSSSKVPDAQRIERCAGKRKQPAQENQPTPSTYPRYPEWSDSSQVTLGAQHSAAGPSHMVPVPSPRTHRDSVASLYSLRSSPGLQDDLVAALPLPGEALDDTPVRIEGRDLSQQDTSSVEPEAPQKRRRTGKRKRVPNPKDPRAAKRLQDQRHNDDECIEMLFNLIVPKDVGQVAKKDRLLLSTSQSFRPFVWMMNECFQLPNMRRGWKGSMTARRNVQQP